MSTDTLPDAPPAKSCDEFELSAARYRYLVEQSGEMISTHRPGDWTYTSINPAVAAITGWEPSELIGVPAYNFFHPEDAERMKRRTIPAIYRHGVRTFRYRARHKRGHYYWVESTHRSIRDPETGDLIEVIAVTRDITPQVQAEMETRRLARVVQVTSDLIVFCDQRLQLQFLNAAALQGFGVEASEINGARLSCLLDQDDYNKFRALALSVAEYKGVWQGQLRLSSKRFADRIMVLQQVLNHSKQAVADSDAFYSLIIRDITEQEIAEQQAKNHHDELAHALRLLSMGEMASGLAHELNQPLATTLNYARGGIRQIDSGQLHAPPALVGVLRQVVCQVQRAAGIIKRMRNLIQKTPYHSVDINVNELCREVGFFLEHVLSDYGIQLQWELVQPAPEIQADRVQMEQILINLLNNAVDALYDSQRENPLITVATAYDKHYVVICVSDNAGAVCPELGEKIFLPHVSSKQDGLGMGLSIVRSLVEAHGGQIELDLEQGGITRFRVSLPIGKKSLQSF